MIITGDPKNEIRVRTVVDYVLQGKLERALGYRLFLSGNEFNALQLIEPSATKELVVDAARSLVSMLVATPGYTVRIVDTPIGPQLELLEP